MNFFIAKIKKRRKYIKTKYSSSFLKNLYKLDVAENTYKNFTLFGNLFHKIT